MGDSFTAVDMFCGAGGVSKGLMRAAEKAGVDINLTAIDHWDRAIKTHKANFPQAKQLCEPIEKVNPRDLFGKRRIDLLWASPECTNHSRAKGGMPRDDQSRSTAMRVTEWITSCYIQRVYVENVKEFTEWGPLGANGKPLASRKGELFQYWLNGFRAAGYRLKWKIKTCADFGDATSRERFFLIAVRGNEKLVWPKETHTDRSGEPELFDTNLKPWRTASDIIDFSNIGRSVFHRPENGGKVLGEATLNRLWHGLHRHSGSGAGPWIARLEAYMKGRGFSVPERRPDCFQGGRSFPFLTIHYGCSKARFLESPVPTITAKGEHIGIAFPAGFMAPQQRGSAKQFRTLALNRPGPTLTCLGAEAVAMPLPVLDKYYKTGAPQSVTQPIATITTKERFALLSPGVNGACKPDLFHRMLTRRELAAAHSMTDMVITGNKREQVEQIGNSVPICTAEAFARTAMA